MTDAPSPRRGRLRIYLGAAPGVGKTFAMLDEGSRRRERGADVVVGLVETHGRAATAEALGALEVLPRARVTYRGVEIDELDVAGVIARRPDVALVDELAHTNPPGMKHAKRWQDVDDLLAAGIDVITTVNVQHLESLNDVVFAITGVRQNETVPDHVVRAADQIELVDMSPQALRKRLAHGNVYAPDKIDAALTNYFREGNLTALREIALLWLADRVDSALDAYRELNEIREPWKTRERVVVALGGGPEGDALVRRGIRIVERASGGQLHAVHVAHTDGLVAGGADDLARQRRLVEDAGGTFHLLAGSDVAAAVLDFARGVNASQIVVGESTRSRLVAAFSLTDTRALIRGSGDIDILVVTHGGTETGIARRRRESGLSRRRVVTGWLIAGIGVPVLAGLLSLAGGGELSFALMSFLAVTVVVAAVGGLGPALLAATLATLGSNVLFTEPRLTFRIERPEDGVAVVLLFVVAVGVSRMVAEASRRTREAAAARAESDLVTSASLDVIAGDDAIGALLARLREGFGLEGIEVVRPNGARVGSNPDGWRATDDALTLVMDDGAAARIVGPALEPRATRVILAVTSQAVALAERRAADAELERARTDRARGEVRGAILAAVSHDLRTPLAGIKAAASALASPQFTINEEDARELVLGIEASADRLQSLVDNLLDMTRIDAGIVSASAQQTWVMDLLVAAAAGVDPDRVQLEVAPDLSSVHVDGGLLERVVANLVENAVRHSPASEPVRVSAALTGDDLVITVADRGPGVADDDRERMFESFQRLGDAPRGVGIGLGLAVARGLARALGGDVRADATPGGGLTMVVQVPVEAAP